MLCIVRFPGEDALWFDADQNPWLPFALAQKGRQRLRAAGAALTTNDYEIGHWIAPEEIADAVAFLDGGR